MAAASCLLTEDQFLCSICLDVFTDPVSIPCGHNFCKNCITQHWDINVQCLCPICNKVFFTKPELQVNTLISEMSAQFRLEAQQKSSSSSSSEQQVVKPGEVPCDICSGTKLKALKSCLVCLSSYCETHLEPHRTKSGLKKHQLIDPVKNLEERMCKKHDKLLELFCKTDQTCVCVTCSDVDHRTHDAVPLKEEYEGKKTELVKTEAEIQQMIQERKLKIQEIKRAVELSNRDADREKAEGVQVFTALKESVERDQAEFIETIKEKQRTTEKQAKDFIKDLEKEISDLKRRSSEVEQLSHSEDHFHLLQNFSSLNLAPPTKDWTQVSICQRSYEGNVMRAVAQLEETLSRQTKKLFEAELRRVQQFTVAFDPVKVNFTFVCRCVSLHQGFTSGKFYFEVQVGAWSMWTLGVTRKSNITREILLSPRNGYWTVCANQRGGYSAAADPSVRLSVKSQPEKVGVFVDYEEGLVSFYDADTAALIYSFTDCCFTEKLHPFFSPCCNDGVSGSWWSFFLREHKLCLQ